VACYDVQNPLYCSKCCKIVHITSTILARKQKQLIAVIGAAKGVNNDPDILVRKLPKQYMS